MMHVILLVVLARRVRLVVLAVGHLPIDNRCQPSPEARFSSSPTSFSFYHFLSMRIHTQRPSHPAAGHVTHLSSS